VITHEGERFLKVGGLLVPERAMSFPDEGRDWIERAYFDAKQVEADVPLIMGGAESWPFEGLDVGLNTIVRKTGTTFPDPGFLGLFTSQTATTVPAQTAVLATPTGVTEATGGGYARASIAGSNWPAGATADTTGRRSTVVAPGISFAESSGAYSVTNVNGFFLCTASSAGVALFYANFDSGTAIVVNQAGFQVRIPPFIQLTD
jgi:hypothetical protein